MTDEINAISTIKGRIENGQIKPFDKYTDTKDAFFSALEESNSVLKEQLYNQLMVADKSWLESASNGTIYFSINDCRWKRPKGIAFNPMIYLNLIGAERKPTISLWL